MVAGWRKLPLDNLCGEYEVCMELGGTGAHPADEQWCEKQCNNTPARSMIPNISHSWLPPISRGTPDPLARKYSQASQFHFCGVAQ